MNARIFKIISITLFTLLCLGLVIGLICITVYGCNGNMLMSFTSKKLSPGMLTKQFNMLSQDCLFVEVITNELCVETSFDQKIVENGVVISSSSETLTRYRPGDEFCLSVKNTNTAYSCNENLTEVLITPTLFNSNSRLNNDCIIILLGIIAIYGILAILFIVLYEPLKNLIIKCYKKAKNQITESTQNEEIQIEMKDEDVKQVNQVNPVNRVEPLLQIEPVNQVNRVEPLAQIEPVNHVEIETNDDSAEFSEPIEEY